MKITIVSDLHGAYPPTIGGDLLIVCGDLTPKDKLESYMGFFMWIAKQKYRKKIVIAGNHDGQIQKDPVLMKMMADFEYLEDSGTEFEGLKIWGSPWTPTFYNWHFMKDRGREIREKWDLIPLDTDILVTHGPPYSFLDTNLQGEMCGCMDLLAAVNRVKPRIHCFGHIHEGYGIYDANLDQPPLKERYPIFVNASHMTAQYKAINPPINLDL